MGLVHDRDLVDLPKAITPKGGDPLRLLLPFLLLAFAAPCFGQTAKIESPADPKAGEMVRFNAEFEGDDIDWLIYPPVKYSDAIDRNSKQYFIEFVPKSGVEYMVQLEAYKVTEGKFSKAKHTVLFKVGPPGPTPPNPPGPDPPNPPDPDLTETGKKVREWAKAVGSPSEAKKIAENYGAIISAIAAGAYNSLSFEDARAKIVSDLLQLNSKVVTAGKWTEFGEQLAEHTKALDSQGKLDSVDKIKTMFEEIQAGLEASL